jgi:aspartyl-tRNA(Asn)/glutamyl-tRNA(Gln) amidotransferase subunit A
MSTSELCLLTAWEMARLVRDRQVSPVELIQAHLDRIEELNVSLVAFVHLDADRALDAARRLESDSASRPLRGVPVAYKDIYDVAGMPTTGGSRVLRDNVPSVDCTVAARLRQAGAVCLGKLNTFEFASGSMEVFGDARNPWNLACSPGGSSSGSGTALAARMVALATGSDTGGSIRIPASFCGLSGLRPTSGLVPLKGVIPLSWSLDAGGPMARTVQDAALMLDAMLEADPSRYDHDSFGPVSFVEQIADTPEMIRLGVPRHYFFDEHVNADVIEGLRGAIETFGGMGAEVVEVDTPLAQFGLPASWAIAYSEAFAYHRDNFFKQSRNYTRSFLHKITGAALVGAEEYITAQRIRERVTAELLEAFRVHDLDALVMPSTPYTAFGLNASPPQDMGRLTRPLSLAGLPSLAIPCGFSAADMPIGMQIVGRSLDERTLLQIGHAYQQATDWHRRMPPFTERPVPKTVPTSAPSAPAVQDWVRLRGGALGLTYIEESDWAGISASIAPMLEQLEAARSTLSDTDAPAVRTAPIVGPRVSRR